MFQLLKHAGAIQALLSCGFDAGQQPHKHQNCVASNDLLGENSVLNPLPKDGPASGCCSAVYSLASVPDLGRISFSLRLQTFYSTFLVQNLLRSYSVKLCRAKKASRWNIARSTNRNMELPHKRPRLDSTSDTDLGVTEAKKQSQAETLSAPNVAEGNPGDLAIMSTSPEVVAETASGTPMSLDAEPIHTPDKSTWQGWAEIENDPVCHICPGRYSTRRSLLTQTRSSSMSCSGNGVFRESKSTKLYPWTLSLTRLHPPPLA
jgi:hypothetical protein